MSARTTVTSDTLAGWLDGAPACRDVAFQDVDLRTDDARLAALPQARDPAEACVFIGCRLGPAMALAAADTGALVLPRIPGIGVHPFRTRLYTVDELYRGFVAGQADGYRHTFDRRVYEGYMCMGADGHPVVPPQRVPVGPATTIARRLHDGSVSDALGRFLVDHAPPRGAGAVAIMGGHDVPRTATTFREVARAARELARRGFLVATGGGPGLMEAANLGAWAATGGDGLLDDALAELASSPTFRDPGWVDAAWRVRARRHGEKVGLSVGIPTWFYGHEPPNLFASHVAKYFENSLREEGLLAIATHGVIFAPGRAGTVQEIFQDACQNFYAVYGVRSPMILLDGRYWEAACTGERPGYPARALLQALARDGGFADRVHVCDDPAQAVEIIAAFTP